MYIYIYIHIHIHIHIYIYIYIHTYTYIHIDMCIYIYIYIYVYACEEETCLRACFSGRAGPTAQADSQGSQCLAQKEKRKNKKTKKTKKEKRKTEVHNFDGSTQMHLLSTNSTFAVTPLVLTPFVSC